MSLGVGSVDVESLLTIPKCKRALLIALEDLEHLAASTDFTSLEESELFKDKVSFVKRYYERLEFLLRQHKTDL
jgi:hypothetical protein